MNPNSGPRILPALLAALLVGCGQPGATIPASPAPAGPMEGASTGAPATPGQSADARAPSDGSTVVFVVRHAERASATDRDSPLSEEGRARALALSEALAHAGVDRVLTSQFVRTRDTGAPLAQRLGVPSAIEPVSDAVASSEALARRVLDEHRGETVLIVGHSNTVHHLVRALGGAAFEELSESEYDDLFTVIIDPDGEVSTIRSRYGAPDGEPATPAAAGPSRNS